MLIKRLCEPDKERFLLYAELLSIADKPLLWDGKPKEAITARTDMEKLSLQKGEAESRLLAEWGWKPVQGWAFPGATRISELETTLIEGLKDLPLQHSTEDPAIRWNAVSAALRALLQEHAFTDPYAVRITLYQLMLLALADGTVSQVEYRFLEEFQHHHQVDDLAFKEILERAENMCRETQKTIALILE
jgi:hypothetical protein